MSLRRVLAGVVLVVQFGSVQCAKASGSELKFGLHLHRAVPGPRSQTVTEWPPIAFDSWRLWDAGVAWPNLEPRQGDWHFERLDAMVSLAESARVDVLLPMALCPPWAALRPNEKSAYAPGNASPPRDSLHWREFAHTVAVRYRGRIRAYEVLNEPNLRQFFTGDARAAADLVRIAAGAIRDVDPFAVIVGPAISGPAGLPWLDAFLDAGGGNYLDAVSVHGYSGQGQEPEVAAGFYQEVRRALRRHGLERLPIWNTETGWQIKNRLPIPAGGDTAPPEGKGVLSAELASGYVARAFLVAASSGVQRLYWYAWDNYRMGLVEPDGLTLKPAAKAFAVARSWLSRNSALRTEMSTNNWYRLCTAYDNGDSAQILWSRTGSFRVPVAPGWNTAVVEDVFGVRRRLTDAELRAGVETGPRPIRLLLVAPGASRAHP